MKRILIIALLVFCGSQISRAQCNDQLVNKCYPNITGYTFLKDFKFRLKEGGPGNEKPTARFQLILSKNTKYILTACDAEEYEGKVIFQLFDQTGLLASSYNPQTQKHYESAEFLCKKSGLYYIAYTFEGAKRGCAVGMIAFER